MKSSHGSDALMTALLSSSEMARADRLAAEAGVSGEALMRRAAAAVAEGATAMAPGGPVAVLAGRGNNGGDAYGCAALLRAAGRSVTVFAAAPVADDRSDAALMAREWGGEVRPVADFGPGDFALTIDGLFGAGLSHDIAGVEAEAIERLNAGATPVLSIDLPSGVSGDDGRIRGTAVRADRTVTFFRRKPGHLLQPGRDRCGDLVVADIGLPTSVLGEIRPRIFANEPALFAPSLLRPEATHHKYDRGHAVVFSGPSAKTGAARLAATAALRGGAGLVTVFSPASAMLVNAGHLTAVMLRRCEDVAQLAAHLADERLGVFVLGPGFGDAETARCYATMVLRAGRKLVLDADGISAFAGRPEALFETVSADGAVPAVLTPHDGEFKRLFPDLAPTRSKIERARAAAERSGAVIVLKGPDTVIAAPDGRAAINANAPSNLATAGSGDVLSGLVAAQLANGVPAFEAACAAIWIHAEAASGFGPGLIAEDLPGLVPRALAALQPG